MAKSKKEDWIKAFRRLPFRDRIILLIVALIGVGALVVLFFAFMFKGRVLSGSTFPEAKLSAVNTKSYTVKSYDDLPYHMGFPSTDYYIGVPGGASVSMDDGASIVYNSNIRLVLSVKASPISIPEAVSQSWYGYITGLDGSSSYTAKSNSTGYANSLVFDYEVGYLSGADNGYTVMTYSYDTNEGYILFISAAVSSDESISQAADVLHEMLYTLYRDDGTDSSQTETSYEDNKTSSVSSAEGSSIKWIYSDVSTEGVSVKEFEPNYIHSDLPIDNGPLSISENPVVTKTFTVDSELAEETVIFYLKYSIHSYTPDWIMLVSPYEEVYSSSYENEELDGYVFYLITNPVEGDWTIHIPNASLGSYVLGMCKEQDFER